MANNLGSGFHLEGLARMSSDENLNDDLAEEDVQAASSDQDDEVRGVPRPKNGQMRQKIQPVLATPEKTSCYSRFEPYPVRVEGPEFSQDFTYYLVDKMPDLANFERGIWLSKFNSSLVAKRIELEFRTLQKMCFHKDHVLNLFTSFDIQFHKINRYKDILPFLHNRVVLKENPILPEAHEAANDDEAAAASDLDRSAG